MSKTNVATKSKSTKATSTSTVFSPTKRNVFNYVIETGIPLPARTGGGNSKFRIAVEKMNVSDSVFIPNSMSTKAGLASVRSMLNNVQKSMNRKFAVRKVENGRYRLWRTA